MWEDVKWEYFGKWIKETLDSNGSTSQGCSRCCKFDIQACVANLANQEELIKAKDAQLKGLNMLVTQGYEGNTKPEQNIKYKAGRHPCQMDDIGDHVGSKVTDRKVVNGKDAIDVSKGGNLDDLMNIAHGMTTTTPSQVKKDVEAHDPSPSYTCDYMLSMDHNG